ncbi:hypothetical protein TWF970_009502 [Orbilia oligospora]|uniref:DUF221-domain-containing protein n=1 Tax=Orbilia oligospora TaxID=2813651 RepID=A0A7C8VBM9_ORBOL|nr:hypothetical protein TWF970_009502 [Orbilia oligospora]
MATTCPWSSSGSLYRRDEDAGQKLLGLLRNSYQRSLNFSDHSFYTSLGTSIGISFGIFALFCLLRPHNATVYAPRLKYSDEKHAPPPIEKGYLAWLSPVFKYKEDDLVNKIGLDAIVFLRFLRMLRNLFATLSLLAIIMIGVNAGCSAKNKHILNGTGNFFIFMSPQIVYGECLYAHILMSWVFPIVICGFIWHSYRKLLQLKVAYFESEEYKSSLHSKTLMVTDVSSQYMSNDGLADIIRRINADPNIKDDMKARIARDMKELPKLVHEHEMTVRRLESVLAKYLKNPDRLPPNRPTMKPFKDDRKTKGEGKIDAIEYLDERIKMLETRIKEVRGSIDLKKPLPYGFVSFSTMQNAHTVAYATRGKRQAGADVRLAPRPTDLLWHNLSKTKGERRWSRTWGWMLYGFFTVAWIVPNAFIATFLPDISLIGQLWPAFLQSFIEYNSFWVFVQGVIAPLLTSLIFLVLPIIMRRISARQGDFTKTARERHTTTKLFSFFLFNNLIVFTIFGTVWNFVVSVISDTDVNKKSVWQAIKDFRFATQTIYSVFQVSRFWIMYLLQRNLGAVLDLIQFVTLFMRWYSRKFLSPTPREMIEWSAPQPMDFASYYNYFLFYATIAFTFAPIQPLVVPVACLYFTIDSFFRKYAFMYMFVTKTESGGMFWRVLVNRVLVGSSFGNIVTAGVVWINFNGRTAVWALFPIIIPIGFKIYCMKVFDNKLDFYTKVVDAENTTGGAANVISETAQKKHREDRLSDRYGHPALTRKLLTPLVHEKAKHVLARVYSIRNNEEDQFSAVNGSFPFSQSGDNNGMNMQKMQSDKPGLQAPPTGLEHYGFVQEHQLDYNNLAGQQRQEFNYIFDSAAANVGGVQSRGGSPSLRPITPGALSMLDNSRPGTPSGLGPSGYATNRMQYTSLGSPGLAPQQLTLPTGRSVSPLARDASASPDPNYYLSQPRLPEGMASDSDLAGLLAAPGGAGHAPHDGYDSRAVSRDGYDSRGVSRDGWDDYNSGQQQQHHPQGPVWGYDQYQQPQPQQQQQPQQQRQPGSQSPQYHQQQNTQQGYQSPQYQQPPTQQGYQSPQYPQQQQQYHQQQQQYSPQNQQQQGYNYQPHQPSISPPPPQHQQQQGTGAWSPHYDTGSPHRHQSPAPGPQQQQQQQQQYQQQQYRQGYGQGQGQGPSSNY